VAFSPVCLFCKKARKKKGGTEEHLGLCETKEAEQTIKAAAVAKQDNALLAKISDVDFCCKEVRYHHSCRSAYLLDTPSVSKPTDSTALSCIYGYIEKSVIVDKRPELLTSIYIRYKELCEDAEEAPITTARNLATNLSNKFGDKIRIECSAARKSGHIVYLTGLDSQLVHLAYDYAATPEATINKAALLLRKAIKKTPTTPLPENVTLQSLFQGEITAPNLLLQFFQVLYGGPNQKAYSPKLEQRVLSASHDAMFIAQRGKVKPGKQIVLGMAIKSMTGSRKLIEMLNRHGHIINYHAIEEIETSLGEEIQSRELACPEGTISDMNFGLAFDNFDELPETLSGAGTLHDTMGILYQNKGTGSNVNQIPQTSLQPSTRSAKKRKLEVHDLPLDPYRKKPRVESFHYEATDAALRPDNRVAAKEMDLAWMICHALKMPDVPMWTGFNALRYDDNTREQNVLYMKNLNKPITSLDVVQETMTITQKCAQECGQEYGIVTYDLNAAKPAMQIQLMDSPKFDNLFIMLVPFTLKWLFSKPWESWSILQVGQR